ncbi:MAG: nucleotidyltransferase domain-containing protein [Armatimonadota bacterium]|nr:nucleotidyltransferase domain-containing protein [Armatimonadota bacterium]MDR7444692.1 nucleotidyltransferase domain-containing protein [Armatimonadota bacterium]MDR7569186.1 nucleotidyltransferase domain-containing protein [Armatimonadota bacterium]MDR7613304.1 nucleotidyltransferase domain-containing protein [Armatimonadota bacterium]
MNRDESTAGLRDPVLDSAVRRIVERLQPLRIILFGSRARGEAGRWSDFDFLVVLPEVRDKRTAMVEALRALNGLRDPQGMPVAVDVIVTSPAEIDRRGDVPGSVLRSALREGRVVYERG